jgi:hypothetical protein
MKVRLLLLSFALLWAVGAHAHEFSVSWQVEGGRLTVRAVADDVPAAGAAVELLDCAGAVLARGTLDGAGCFHWPLTPGAGDLVVTVHDGAGHRRSVVVPAARLWSPAGSTDHPALTEAPVETGADHPSHPGGHSAGAEPLAVRVVAGLAFLLAAAAVWMSYRNHRRLAELERRVHSP